VQIREVFSEKAFSVSITNIILDDAAICDRYHLRCPLGFCHYLKPVFSVTDQFFNGLRKSNSIW